MMHVDAAKNEFLLIPIKNDCTSAASKPIKANNMLDQPTTAAWQCPGCKSWIAPGVSVCPECKPEKNEWNKPISMEPGLPAPGPTYSPILLVDEEEKGNLINERI